MRQNQVKLVSVVCAVSRLTFVFTVLKWTCICNKYIPVVKSLAMHVYLNLYPSQSASSFRRWPCMLLFCFGMTNHHKFSSFKEPQASFQIWGSGVLEAQPVSLPAVSRGFSPGALDPFLVSAVLAESVCVCALSGAPPLQPTGFSWCFIYSPDPPLFHLLFLIWKKVILQGSCCYKRPTHPEQPP